jgi:ribosomal protein L20
MRKTELFNNVSPELIKSTKLKPGEKVVYRILNIQRNPMDPTKWAIPSIKAVPPVDQIYDEKAQEYVDIAAVRTVDPKGEHSFHEIHFYGNQGGMLVLNGGRAADQEIHSYLSLCNYNASNPNRDTTKEAIFEFVDESARSEKERKNRNIKREALNAAYDLSGDEVKNYIAALGQDDTRPMDVLRNQLESMADNDPKAFLDLINNKQASMKAVINRAVSKGVILFDSESSRYTWPNGEAILTVARTTAGDAADELVSFCVSSAKGEKVFQTIQSKSKK